MRIDGDAADAERVLFLFAHQDDEYAAAPWITDERSRGARVFCLYVTDGASRVPAAVRDAESLAVLSSLGVDPNDVVFADDGARIGDGTLPANAERAWRLVEAWCDAHAPLARLYAPAWEGGHHDHDAAHVIAVLAALRHGLIGSAWQFSLYHAHRTPRPFFRSLAPLPADAPRRTFRHTLAGGWRHAQLCWRYPSQRRTWLGLFPEAFVHRVLLRRESLVALDPLRVLERPHDGTLLYERLFGARYDEVRADLAPLLERVGSYLAGAKTQ